MAEDTAVKKAVKAPVVAASVAVGKSLKASPLHSEFPVSALHATRYSLIKAGCVMLPFSTNNTGNAPSGEVGGVAFLREQATVGLYMLRPSPEPGTRACVGRRVRRRGKK